MTVLIQPLAGLAISVLALRESHIGDNFGEVCHRLRIGRGLRPNQVRPTPPQALNSTPMDG